jgi:hypothetical protein
MNEHKSEEQRFCPHGIRDGAANCIACEDPTKLGQCHCDVVGGCPELRAARSWREIREHELRYVESVLVNIRKQDGEGARASAHDTLQWLRNRLKAQRPEKPSLAYYETHEPPHCPTCDCGTPRTVGWQPIETAPKIRVIDLWTGDRRMTRCYWDDICGEWRTTENSGVLMRFKKATHWMEIPVPPSGDKP